MKRYMVIKGPRHGFYTEEAARDYAAAKYDPSDPTERLYIAEVIHVVRDVNVTRDTCSLQEPDDEDFL